MTEGNNYLALAVLLTFAALCLWAAQPGMTGKRTLLLFTAAVLLRIDPAMLFVAVAFAGLVFWGLWHGDDFAC